MCHKFKMTAMIFCVRSIFLIVHAFLKRNRQRPSIHFAALTSQSEEFGSVIGLSDICLVRYVLSPRLLSSYLYIWNNDEAKMNKYGNNQVITRLKYHIIRKTCKSALYSSTSCKTKSREWPQRGAWGPRS